MVVYTIHIIHGGKCDGCKKRLPEILSKTMQFPLSQQCACGKNHFTKDILDGLGGKVSIKTFDSDRLYAMIAKTYVDKNFSIEYANSKAQGVVAREKVRFEQKYGF